VTEPEPTAPVWPAWRSLELGRRTELTTLRAALWTARALRSVKRSLPNDGLRSTVPAPPALPWRSTRGVYGVLVRQPNTCLERALVLQAWLLAHGHAHDVIVGVNESVAEFAAHAWLDYEDGSSRSVGFVELTRVPVGP